MNFRTTIGLLAALVVSAGGYLLWSKKAAPERSLAKPPMQESLTLRDVLEKKPTALDKLTIKRKGEPDWVFVKDEAPDSIGRPAWRMTTPVEAMAQGFEIDRIVRQISELKYAVVHRPGEPGSISAADARLEPPELVVTLSSKDEAPISVQIGRPASENETYVRIDGKPEVYIANSNLRTLAKPRAIEYRDPQLWNFPAEKATAIEVVDHSNAEKPITYTFAKGDKGWLMKSPTAARATAKVDELVRSMNRLRVAKWEDDRKDKLAVYGLDPAPWTVSVTVEEEVTPKPAAESTTDEAAEKPQVTEKKITVYTLHLSDRSPLGDDTKAYVRVGAETMAATLPKSVADKLKPQISEWRDMKVTSAPVTEATRIEIAVPDGEAALVKTLGRWAFEKDSAHAEDAAVNGMLKTLQDLTAVAFTDDEKLAPNVTGMEKPKVDLRLTIPGQESVERIRVGEFTDPSARRLVYVQRNEQTSIAKVRQTDLAQLLQPPRAYRDRGIAEIYPTWFEAIELTIRTPHADVPQVTKLERRNDAWSITSPVAASVNADRVTALVSALGSLRAESIVADDAAPSQYGLDKPGAVAVIMYRKPTEASADGVQEAAAGNPDKVTVSFAVKDGRHFAMRADRPTIYQIPSIVYQQLYLELRPADVWTFADGDVKAFSYRIGEQTHRYERAGSRWKYAAEPDLPLDSTKVQNSLLQIRDLKTERYARYGVEDLSGFGLDRPQREITVELNDGSTQSLLVSGQASRDGSDRGNYAMRRNEDQIFIMTEDSMQRVKATPADLEKTAGDSDRVPAAGAIPPNPPGHK